MKLSFSKSSKPNSKPPIKFSISDPEIRTTIKSQEFVTSFDSSKTLADPNPKNHIIIPPKENEWRPIKKMKNIDLPIRSSEDRQFEIEAPSFAESLDSDGIAFGLNLRQNTVKEEEANGVFTESHRVRPISVEDTLLQKFKDDLERLPEHGGLSEFDDVPVEGFGAALLAGYGWYEGRGIGKNAKGDIDPVQYERRTGKEGLGFVADVPASRDDKKKENKKENERLDKGNFIGNIVRIIRGSDMGRKGTIVEVLKSDSLVLKLSGSKREVKVWSSDVAELRSEEEEKCLKRMKDMETREAKDENRSRNEHKRHREEEKVSTVSWLTSHIRVRVISKKVKGGKFYLKKGKIVDVVGPKVCDIAMDGSGEIIQGIDQELLETALPRSGGPVCVLYGKHKGVFGNLMEKDMNKETGVVQDADSHAMINVKLEQIAEYTGDPSLIGY